jgi:hypothetical protein
MLQSSSLWTSIGKIKIIRKRFDHAMFVRFHMRKQLDPGDAFDVRAKTVTIG